MNAPVDNTIKFNQQIIDFAGDPIAGLAYRVIVGKTVYNGVTDEKGICQEIADLMPLEPLEIFICKANGDYASKYKGYTQFSDMNVCAVSPHIKVPLSTDLHEGEPVAASPVAEPVPPAAPPTVAATKAKPSAPPLPTAPGKGQIESNGRGANKETMECRNASGHPTATLKERIADWAKRNRIPTLGIWSWDDFKPDASGCTAPAAKGKYAASGTPTDRTTSSGTSMSTSKAAGSTSAPSNTSAPVAKVASIDQAAPKKVTDLIKIMEEQTGWEWKKMYEEDKNTSIGIKTGLLNGTFSPRTGKKVTQYNERCYPSVKIGLWRAGLVDGFNNDIPAKKAGAWLADQHFVEISKTIPDARWALPGDVIVYKYPDAKEAANIKKIEKAIRKYEIEKADYELRKMAFEKELGVWQSEIDRRTLERDAARKSKKKYNGGPDPKKPTIGARPEPPDDKNYGHIDVRTYDGYLSDFRKSTLPSTDGFVVIGIYRKVFDPMPDLRLRAFLKVLREWECHGEKDDSKRYYMLPGKGTFTDTKTHPFEGKETKNGTPSGAYQIILKNYVNFLKGGYGLEPGFTPLHQDRMAVLLLEVAPAGNALAEIRKGNIEKAVDIAKETWASLPGGTQPRQENGRKFTMADVLRRYNDFLNEQIK
jgi:muramidase (phage lysozyme)